MGTTTIQVTEETRDRLKEYKLGAMSYEEVLRLFMEVLRPREFHRLYRKWQSDIAEQVRASKRWRDLEI